MLPIYLKISIYMHTKKTEETPTDSSHKIGIFSNFALE